MAEPLKRTNLYQWHVDHGGRMVPFAGWEMPVMYPAGPIEEHHVTRRSAGLFDIDHMGQITVTGPDAQAYLNRLVTWDITRMALNEAHYALICYPNGGIVDDIFIYKMPDRWFLAVNASNLDKDYQWLLDHMGSFKVTVSNISDETYMLALQGPRAIELLQHLTPTKLNTVARFTAFENSVAGIPTLVGRTGYTGEDGVELFFPADRAKEMWTSILAKGEETGIEINPIGLAARDSLRFEPAFPLYGHEINQTITPLEANLGWACNFEADFIGKEALLRQKAEGLGKKLVGFELTDKGVPREGYIVTNNAGQEIGFVATGLYAPTVNKYCGHAFVKPEYAKPGTAVQVMIRNKPKAAVVVKRPFYVPAYR